MANNWTRQEVAAIVPDYFDMLTKELSGQNYIKAEHRRQLQKLITDRTEGSIERKHMNISAVLIEKGLPYISGYKPYHHYQALLKEEVEKYLNDHPELYTLFDRFFTQDITTPEVKNILNSEVDIPEFDKRFSDERIDYIIKSDINYYEREQRNKKLGLLGEEFIIKFEKQKLINYGQESLSRQVEHISQTIGDSAGFDVLSYDNDGNEKFIEVKTTQLGKNSPFYFTRNELGFSKKEKKKYSLYRVFNFQKKPRFFQLMGSLDETCKSISTEFMGWPK